MEKRLRQYLQCMGEIKADEMSVEERRELAAKMLIQIQFFQHERLIHLIVTVTFAILTVMSVLGFVATAQIGLLILTGMFFMLLVPYIRHYYILENGVQKLYQYYDNIVK